MTTATATNLGEAHARFLNVMYGLTKHPTDGGHVGFVRFGHAMWRANLPDRETLYGLVRSGLARMRDSLTTADLDPAEASEDRIISSHLSLTAAGIAWVEDNPRNALFRKVNASPLGRVTIRRALEVTGDRAVIRDVLRDGYVSLHTIEDRMEVPARLLGQVVRHFPDDYILLPTPKIRKVLG